MDQKLEIKRVLCLDLDGTVRRSKSGKQFHSGPDDLELMPGILEKILKYRKNKWRIVGISNQAGVAHGFKTPEDIDAEMEVTMKLVGDEGFHIVRWCYFDEKGNKPPYNIRSLCRKPSIGMLVEEEIEMIKLGYMPDWNNSLFVGDRDEDREVAANAKIPFMHIDEFLKK